MDGVSSSMAGARVRLGGALLREQRLKDNRMKMPGKAQLSHKC